MSEEKKLTYDFTFQGKVVEIMPLQTFASGFKKRTLVIDNTSPDKDWENPVPFTFNKEDVKKLDGIAVGQIVKVSGWLKGRRWDGPKGRQYFLDANVYGKVEVIGGAATVPQAAQPAKTETTGIDAADASDMPF